MKKNIASIIIGLLISVFVVLFKNNFSSDLINQHYGMQGAIEKDNIDTLYVGSSLFKQGIDPYQISDDSYILTYNGNQPVLIELELEYLINKGVKINNLVVDMYNGTITSEPNLSDIKLLWDGDYTFKMSLLNIIKNNLSLSDYYSYFVTSNNDYLLTYPISNPVFNSLFYKGGKNYITNGTTKENLYELITDNYSTDINYEQIAAINGIANICKDNDINLCFVETPKYETLQTDLNYKTVMEEYANILQEINIDYITFDRIDFDNSNPDYYSDLIHLSSNGSVFFTKAIETLLNSK